MVGDGTGGIDTLRSVEAVVVIATGFADTLIAGGGNDQLYAQDGDDVLFGHGGDDLLGGVGQVVGRDRDGRHLRMRVAQHEVPGQP